MKELTLTIPIRVFSYEELDEADRHLIDTAREATRRSYAPYSRFAVGAALRLIDGTIVSGSNQENAASPSGLCAERTTLFYANSRYPDQAVDTLAIAARNERGEFLSDPISPCGACRQVMVETEKRETIQPPDAHPALRHRGHLRNPWRRRAAPLVVRRFCYEIRRGI